MKSLRFMGWIRERDVLNEFTINFGKYTGKDHTDPEIPNQYFNWLVTEKPDIFDRFTPEEKKQIYKRMSDAGYRGSHGVYSGSTYTKNAPQAPRKLDIKLANQPRNAEPTPAAKDKPATGEPLIHWYLAKVKKGYDSLHPGQYVAVYKQSDGKWLFVTLDNSALKGFIEPDHLKDVIESVKDGNNVISANTIPEVKKKLEQWKTRITKSTHWIWAKSIADRHEEGITPGEDLGIIRMDNGDWHFRSLDDRDVEGEIKNEEIAKVVQSIKGDDGKTPISSTSIEKLKKMVEKANRQPNPYQDAVIEEFANTDKNIVINALAGTGKTTTLKRLARDFKKPGERWIYLVYNNKNQKEAERKFKEEGIDIEVKTSHSFLGDVLKANAKMGLITPSKLPDKDPKTKKQEEKIGAVMEQPWYFKKAEEIGAPTFNHDMMGLLATE
jgi:Type III restriction enzyme, res subunit